MLNGSQVLAQSAINRDGGNKQTNAYALYYLEEGDYVEVFNRASSSTTVNQANGAYGYLSMVRVGGAGSVGACVQRAATQTIASASVTPIAFDTVVRDDFGLSDIGGANPEQLTIPAGEGGWYIVIGNCAWAANTDNYVRKAVLNVNGSAVAQHSELSNYTGTNFPGFGVGMVLKLADGDVLTVDADNSHVSLGRDLVAGEQYLAAVRVGQ